jgi:hypothetical protein
MKSGVALKQAVGPWADHVPAAANSQDDELSVLRRIGWSKWDPRQLNGTANGDADDQYDPYLVRVARGLQDGELEAAMIDYLLGAEAYHMGRQLTSDGRVRARATVAAIQDYLRSIH